MAARKSHSRKPSSSRENSSSNTSQHAASPDDSARKIWSSATFLLGTMLVWCMLAPQDSVSVFDGSAVPQNLFWLVLAVLTSLAVALVGLHFQFSGRQWLIVGGCLVWFVLATILAGRDNNPRIAWNGFWQVIAFSGCYFSARALAANPQTQFSIVLVLLTGSIALAIHGLHQVWIEFPADRARYLADPEKVLAEVGIDAPVGSVARRRFEDRLLHSSEPYATFALANSLAVLLSGGIVLLFGLSVAALRGEGDWRQSNSKPKHSKLSRSTIAAYLALTVAAIVMLLCWFLTRSRIAYPALLVGGAYWFAASGLRAQELKRYLTWGLVIGGGGIVAGLIWILRNDSLVLSEAPKSLSYRLEYWLATLDMLKEHWLFGIGLGNYQSYYPIYKLPAASEIIADPHNWLLDIFVSLSVPLGCVLATWMGVRLFSTTPDPSGQLLSSSPDAIELPPHPSDLHNSQVLLWGASLGGVICALLLSLLNGMNLSITAVTWLPAALCVFLLRRRLGTNLVNLKVTGRAAAITMLVCLLVSGSWQASGIAVPLLLMLVLGDESAKAEWKSPKPDDSCSGWSKWAICFLPMVGLLVFLFQCWRPTTTSWSLTQQAANAANPEDQLRLTISAVQADRLNSEPLRWQAELLVKAAELASSEQFPRLAEQSREVIETWLEIDSVKSLNWEWAGRQALVLTAKAQNLGLDEQKFLELALGYYEQAVARYPSSIGLRAQMAVNLSIAGKWKESKRELDAAIELDKQTPHLDKKLNSQLLWLPLLPEGAEQQFEAQQPNVEAEPMSDWLRKKIAEQL